jgi:hydrogenase-4 component E
MPQAASILVEIGVLLDLFTGVFVMGIIIHHISREFASISTEHLTELKE